MKIRMFNYFVRSHSVINNNNPISKMKKTFNTLFLGILFIFTIAMPLSAEIYYRSNVLGMLLEQIDKSEFDEHEYIVTVIKSKKQETQILFQNQNKKETKTITQTNGHEIIERYRNNTLIQQEKKKDGKPVLEIYFNDLGEEEKVLYEWNNNKLVEKHFYLNGKLVYKDNYISGGDGSMRQVRRVFNDDELELISGYFLRHGLPARELHRRAGKDIVYYYSNGTITCSEQWEDEKLISKAIYVRGESTLQIFEEYFQLEKTVERFYDHNNRLLQERTIREQKLEEYKYHYHGDKLIKKEYRAPAARLTWEYEYDEDNELKKEIAKEHGEIKYIKEYISEREYIEKRYRNNAPVFQIHIKDNDIIEEITLNNDKVQ